MCPYGNRLCLPNPKFIHWLSCLVSRITSHNDKYASLKCLLHPASNYSGKITENSKLVRIGNHAFAPFTMAQQQQRAFALLRFCATKKTTFAHLRLVVLFPRTSPSIIQRDRPTSPLLYAVHFWMSLPTQLR